MRRIMLVCLVSLLCSAQSARAQLGLQPIGTYASGIFDQSAAEIPAFDPLTDRLFVVNATQGVDVLDVSNPFSPSLLFQISAPGTNSVAVHNGILAVAVENANPQLDGTVHFYDTSLPNGSATPTSVTVGALPDMLTFTPSGDRVLVANEGEPSDDYSVDPEGSVSIIDISGGVGSASVSTASLSGVALDGPVRIFGPGATVAQDLEPEYIAVAPDGNTAYVAMQENNALGILDLTTNSFTKVKSLGFKDHSILGNGLDANRADLLATIENLPIFGMYQPDAIATYQAGGQTYVVTANEGDGRDYDGFSEEADLKDLILDNTVFSQDFRDKAGDSDFFGKLTVTTSMGDTDGDNDVDEIYAFGGRSFSIFDADGDLVFDSGDAFEQFLSTAPGIVFNASNDNNTFDNRSDNKGPEPEAVSIGEIDGTTYAFIGLERVGGLMVYDITNPFAPTFVEYINNRDFSETPGVGNPLDLGPEGIVFVSADDSPIGTELVIVSNEVSGTTTIFAAVPEPLSASLGACAVLIAACTRRRFK